MRAFCVPLLVLATLSGSARAQSGPALLDYRVLFVGNSLTYVNNLPAVVAALAAAQPDPISVETATYVQGGGSLAERWQEGTAASALRRGGWDAIVLQERGAVPACVARAATRRERSCRESIDAHRAFAALAHAQGARVLLLETWDDAPATPPLLHDGTRWLASAIEGEVVHTGDALQAYVRRHGLDAAFADPVHPRLSGTLIMAAQIHKVLTGAPPVPATVHIAFRLLPPEAPIDPRRPIESQLPLMRAPVPHVLTAEAVRPFLEFAATR